jgi:predicted nucleic acid-binding protein
MIHGLDTSFLVAMELAAHAEYSACRKQYQRLYKAGDSYALAPQVLAEFIHTVTDPRRFSLPLKMEQAVERAQMWENATGIIHAFPTTESSLQFLDWLDKFKLGRKRLLDTMLATTYLANGISSILTLNRDDFTVFDAFTFPK